MLGVEIITVIALAAPWPVLAVLGWIFYRASRTEQATRPLASAESRGGDPGGG